MAKWGKIREVARVCLMLRRRSTRASLRPGWRAPVDVPAGHVAISVGSSGRRFVVRAAHLNHPVFRELLAEAEEEYGFSARAGPLAVPCDESRFEEILRQISSSSSSATRFANLDDLNGCFSCFHVGIRRSSSTDSSPLLRRFSKKSVWRAAGAPISPLAGGGGGIWL